MNENFDSGVCICTLRQIHLKFRVKQEFKLSRPTSVTVQREKDGFQVNCFNEDEVLMHRMLWRLMIGNWENFWWSGPINWLFTVPHGCSTPPSEVLNAPSISPIDLIYRTLELRVKYFHDWFFFLNSLRSSEEGIKWYLTGQQTRFSIEFSERKSSFGSMNMKIGKAMERKIHRQAHLWC